MAPFQDEDEQDLCQLQLQIGSTFRRDGVCFEVMAIDAVEHLVTCKSVDGDYWRTFYNFGGRHPFYENIRMNDVDMVMHPNRQHDIYNPRMGPLGFANRYNSNVIDEVAFGSRVYADAHADAHAAAPQLTLGRRLTEIVDQIYDEDDDIILETRIGQPLFYNFYEQSDNVPDLDETAFLQVGYRFYITADGIVPYTITAVDGNPVHTIESCDSEGVPHRFRIKSYGKEDAEPLQLRDMVEFIE